MNREINVGVCKGRYDLPIKEENYIFQNYIDNPRDTAKMLKDARGALLTIIRREIGTYTYPKIKINIYVTGLTVATIAILKASTELANKISLFHYDVTKEEYYEQLFMV